VDVIIPVRNMASQLADCIAPVIDQLTSNDRVVVVDDASTDATGRVAETLGADVLRVEESRGPYYARHLAAMQSTADMLVFIDGRSRPLPGLVDAHKALLSRPGVALSCTETLTRTGPRLAERISAKRQPFALDGYVGVPMRLDFFPTCNLGVRVDAYRHVGGFRHMRSGGDADLCWRIQKAGLGGMAADPRVLMEWVPRTSLKDTLEQWYRYGKSTRYLEWVWPDQSPKSTGRGLDWRRTLLTPRGAETAASAAFAAGLWLGGRHDMQLPQHYGLNPS
jgi:glycosyltransferase involved in cell wall biosynthesis